MARRYSPYEIERINKIPILEVAKRLGIEVGRNYKAICIFHNDKHPSLNFNVRRNIFKCFACGEGGNVISLVMKGLNVSFPEAIKWLKGDSCLTDKPIITTRYLKDSDRPHGKANPDIYQHFLSLCEDHTMIYEFFCKKKGIKKEVIEKSQIRLLSKPHIVKKELLKSWKIEQLVECSIFSELIDKTTGEISYFLYWSKPNTFILPFFNEKGRIVYLKGRSFDNQRSHLNLKGIPTDIYNRLILKNLKSDEKLYICEGETDTLSALSMGLNAIGILGVNSFKTEYIDLLRDYQLYLVPDNDEAGQRMSQLIKDAFRQIGKPVEVIYITDHKDLNEYYAKENN